MADTPDLADTIAAAAAEPASAASDGQSAAARPLADLVAADQHLAAKRAGRRPLRGVAFTRLTTPGALDDGAATGPFDRPGAY